MQICIAENHKLRVKVKVTQLCPALCNPMDWLYSSWNSPGQNTWVGSLSLLQQIFSTQGQTQVSCIAGGFFTSWAIREAQAQGETPLFFSNIVVSGLGVCLNMPERFPGCKMKKRVCVLHHWITSKSSATPWTAVHQTYLSMEFPRQEYWSGLPFPSPMDLPNPGTEPVFPALAGKFFTTEPPGKP